MGEIKSTQGQTDSEYHGRKDERKTRKNGMWKGRLDKCEAFVPPFHIFFGLGNYFCWPSLRVKKLNPCCWYVFWRLLGLNKLGFSLPWFGSAHFAFYREREHWRSRREYYVLLVCYSVVTGMTLLPVVVLVLVIRSRTACVLT